MKRKSHLYERLISEENLRLAVLETNKGHRWRPGHQPNMTTRKVEAHVEEAVAELRRLILEGFEPSPLRTRPRWDKAAKKWRIIAEPKLWPDQYIHHALVQVLQPIFLKGMDYWCCGSVKGRGIQRGKAGIERWMREDRKGTKCCMEGDVRKFYDSLRPEVAFGLLKRKVKDRRFLDFTWRVIRKGFVAGTFFAQWFANFTLAGLDRMIRASEGVTHYTRYMDNLTIFGSSKRALHRVRKDVSQWLQAHRLELKGDWQIYRTRDRQPRAMGYRYSRKGTRLKQQNKLAIRRGVALVQYRRHHHRKVTAHMAAGLLSRMGQLNHCRAVDFRARYIPKKLQRWLKNIVRKERAEWNTSLSLATAS